MKKLQTLDEVKKYIEAGTKAPAVFLPFSIDFVIMKYIRNVKELEEVEYFWDIATNQNKTSLVYTYFDYEEDTPIASDVQIYNGNIIQNGNLVGDIFTNEAGLISMTYGRTSHIFDPRGFKSAEIVKLSDREIIHIYEDYKIRYILSDGQVFDAGKLKTYDINTFQEVMCNGIGQN